MKKIHGFIDPISLGFILSAAIVGVGVTTSNHSVDNDRVAKVKAKPAQEVTIKHATPTTQKNEYSIYSY